MNTNLRLNCELNSEGGRKVSERSELRRIFIKKRKVIKFYCKLNFSIRQKQLKKLKAKDSLVLSQSSENRSWDHLDRSTYPASNASHLYIKSINRKTVMFLLYLIHVLGKDIPLNMGVTRYKLSL